MKSLEVLAVIPARGGSKGVPRKNVRLVAGEPLLAHIIRATREARTLSRVAVSTDDAEIGAVAKQYGAEVIWRPAEISGDTATAEQALLHALDTLRLNEGYEPDVLVYLQCTSPLTLAADIDGTVTALLEKDADTALAVTPFHYFVWQRQDGYGVGVNHVKTVRPRRQDRDPQYLETGAVVVMRVPGFRQAQLRFYGRTALYEIPPERVLEIDDPDDLFMAEAKLRERQQTRSQPLLPAQPAAVVMDFDGVFTDNKVIVFQDGREAAVCNRSDGWGLAQLKTRQIPMLILSTETNPVVRARADKLGLPCLHGQADKAVALQGWLHDQQLDPSTVIYVGNDVNDLGCLRLVGYPVAVADAHPEVKRLARCILHTAGGQGALRELSELILAGQVQVDLPEKQATGAN